MKSMKNEVCSSIWIVIIVTLVLLGTALTSANGAEPTTVPNVFAPNTIISSSKVNENFQFLFDSVPRLVGSTYNDSDVILTTSLQNLLTINVTPKMDGVLLFLINVRVYFKLNNSPGGGNGNISICLSTTSNACPAGVAKPVNFSSTAFPSDNRIYEYELLFPVSMLELKVASKNTPATYYINAKKEELSSGSVCQINASDLKVLYLPAL